MIIKKTRSNIIDFCDIGGETANILAESLKSCKELKLLKICGTNISDKEAVKIVEAIAENPNFQELNLGNYIYYIICICIHWV